MINSLFSDVLSRVPVAAGQMNTAGSADWSKTLPMAGAVDWTKVNPFQVINPITGYSFGATQPQQAPQAQGQQAQPEMSEYQKWLAQQSTQKTMERGGGDRDRTGGLAGNGTNFTDDQWATIKEMNDLYGLWDNPVNKISIAGGLKALDLNPEALDTQGNAVSAIETFRTLQQAYQQEQQEQRKREAEAMAEQARQAEMERVANEYRSRSGYTAPTGYAADGMGPPTSAMNRSRGGGSDSRGGGFGTGSARTGGDGFGGYSR